jgi:hypothetical protein
LPSPKPSPTTLTVSTLNPTTTNYLSTESPLPQVTNHPTLRPNLFNDPVTFVEECHQIFIGDGVVSQVEFADFVANRCRVEGLCNDNFKLSFEQLDVGLQLDFILGACNDDMKDCIDEYGHFGIEGADGIETSIKVLCSSAFEYALSMGLATTSGKSGVHVVSLQYTCILPNNIIVLFSFQYQPQFQRISLQLQIHQMKCHLLDHLFVVTLMCSFLLLKGNLWGLIRELLLESL